MSIEIVNIKGLREFKHERIIKKIPIVTEQMVSSVLLFSFRSQMLPRSHSESDEFYYVMKGGGTITIGEKTAPIIKGDLVLVPKGEKHFLSTNSGEMSALSIRMLPRDG